MSTPNNIILVRASGLAEVWTHTHDNLKFAQYGWRCTTNENSYSDQTLVGNWNQQRFDTDRVLRRQKIPNKDAIDTWNTTYREGNGLDEPSKMSLILFFTLTPFN